MVTSRWHVGFTPTELPSPSMPLPFVAELPEGGVAAAGGGGAGGADRVVADVEVRPRWNNRQNYAVGSEMSLVREALHWDGFSPRVSLFSVSRSATEIDFSEVWEDRPRQVELYRLVDDSDPGRVRVVYEYDFDFDTLPVNLKPQLEACMSVACQNPGSVAWLAFEGSFHFDHLLTDDVADQVYGLCAHGDVPLVVIEDEPEWRALLEERLVDYRERLASIFGGDCFPRRI